MRSSRPVTAVLLAAVVTAQLVLAGLGSPAGALTTIQVAEGVTDNYKASYNADPSVQERRTYLQLHGLSADGVAYTLATVPEDFAFSPTVQLRGDDGTTATLSMQVPSERVDSQSFRSDKTGDFGVLITVKDPGSLAGNPIPVVLTLSTAGTAVARAQVDYRHDATLAGARQDSPGDLALEWNGPGGRWWIGCRPTRTDWEDAAPPDQCSAGADLAVALQGPSRPAPGETSRFVVDVTNTSSSAAPGTQLTIDLPAVVQLQSVGPAGGASCDGAIGESGPTVTCSVPSLAGAGTATVVVRAAPLAVGPVTVHATLSPVPGETATGDDSATYSRTARGHTCSRVGTPGPDVMVSPDAGEVLCGLGGDDTLRGSADGEVLLGGDGNDVLRGNGGNDLLVGGGGDDVVAGGAGRDTVSYDEAASVGVVVNLLQHHSWDGSPTSVPLGTPSSEWSRGYDEVTGIEVVRGTRWADEVVGDGAATRFEGLAGRDEIYGGAGGDQLLGGSGADALYGQDGADRLSGGGQGDELRGGRGADRLTGDAGSDYCNGGGQPADTTRSCELRRPPTRPVPA